MTKQAKAIPFEEFSSNLSQFFEQVIRGNKPVIVETPTGERAVLKPITTKKVKGRKKTEADHAAFLSSLGSWEDFDLEKFLKDNAESRKRSIRPPVDL